VNISVIIPVHNGAAYLQAALDSVFAQTHPATEVIVVDDGSTDATPDILRRHAGRIVLLSQEQRGLAATRNRALDVAQGELVSFLDADDIWQADKLERQVEHLRAHPEHMVVHTAAGYIDTAGTLTTPMAQRPGPRPNGWAYRTLLERNTIFVSSVAIRRRALDDMRFVLDATGCEDWELWLRLAKQHQFGYVDAPLVHYRIHGSNMSRQRESMCRMRVKVMDHVLNDETRWSYRWMARRSRRSHVRELAQICCEQGRFDDARVYTRQLGVFLTRGDVRRLCLCYLPSGMYQALFG